MEEESAPPFRMEQRGRNREQGDERGWGGGS